MDFIKATMGSLQLPHWLIAVGALLVIVGVIGRAIGRRQPDDEAEDDPESAPIPELRPRAPPLPDLLDSRSRKDRRSKPD